MYSNSNHDKGIGPWTSVEENDPTVRTLDLHALQALVTDIPIEDIEIHLTRKW